MAEHSEIAPNVRSPGRVSDEEPSKPSRFQRRLRDVTGTRSFALWFGVLGPPFAWGAHLLLGDGLFELGCGPGFVSRDIYGLPFEFWDVLQTCLFLAVDILAGTLALLAYRRLRRPEIETAEPNPTVLGRARGMAVAGVASAAIYGAVLVYGLLPPLFLQTCSRSP